MASKMSGRWQVIFTILAVIIVAVITGVVVWRVTIPEQSDTPTPSPDAYTLGDAELLMKSTIDMKIKHNRIATGEINMGYGRSSDAPTQCGTKPDLCLTWADDRKLDMSVNKEGGVTCYKIQWEALNCVDQELKDCIDLSKGHWYGGFEDKYQYWPMNTIRQKMAAYVATNSWDALYGGVLERYFLSSTGFGVFVDHDVPLYLSFNENGDNRMCLSAKYDQSPYINVDKKPPKLSYTVCQADHVRAVHDYMSKKFIPRPSETPDVRLFRSPIWSTWAMYKKDINQTQVLQFAKDITDNNFSHSQLEIDDDWTTAYGDMDFTTDKFPDAKGMIAKLNQDGYRVTIWLHPFFNMDSRAFTEAGELGYLVRAPESRLPALTSWWRGRVSGTLDVTNPYAVEWYLNKTTYLKDTYNISSFKFDAGEVVWLPYLYSVNKTYRNPNDYTKKWAELAYKSDPDVRHQEVRVGAGSQNLPIFVRMLDKDSVWDNNNGLKTVIPSALTFGLIGYPFVLPDMIGGNAYDNSSGLEARNYPDAELFIRWMQLNTFLPSLQFSVVPWVYENDTVVNIVRYFTELHENYTSTIVNLAEESTRTGAPIIRPLWWNDPQDEVALTIDSQYLLGNDILVAPIIEKGARARDIYLPMGDWYDELLQKKRPGRSLLKNYRVELHELAYFTRINST